MAQFFISYSRENREVVEKLRKDLQTAGLAIWIDNIGLVPGTPDWDEALRDAIKASVAVLLIASPSSRRSPYVRDEIALAQAADKPIYPVWVAGDDWMDSVPMGLGSTQNVDMRADSYRDNLNDLISALKGQSDELKPYEPGAKPTTPPPANPRNPYKGLRAFQTEDAEDFFGRDVIINEIITSIEDEKRLSLLAVLGASGSGKSSVIMAGVLPELKRKYPDWLLLDKIVPGTHPIESLAVVLARLFDNKSHAAIVEDLNDRSTRGLHRLIREVDADHIILYVDQFEEVFTLVESEDERRQFIELLSTAVREPESNITILLSMRADFYDRPAQYREFGSLIEKNHVLVTPMTLADLFDVVQRPASLPDVGMTFEEGLITEIVFEVREEVAALPLLQFTLDQLFQMRTGNVITRSAYEEIGGVRGALARHAEATYKSLPSEQHKTLARALFLRLIEPGQTEQDTTRRRSKFNELILPDEAQTQILQETASAFVDARLLITDSNDDERTLEVSHEALIREWKRLGTWLIDARDDLRLQKAIATDVEQWIHDNRPTDMLYRGTVLVDAQRWSEENVASRDEMAFINASVQAEQDLINAEKARERRETQIRILGISTIIILLVSAVGFFIYSQEVRAQEQEQRASDAIRAAEVSDSIGQGALAQLIGRTGDSPLEGLSYAVDANAIDSPPIEVQRTLAEIAWQPGAQHQLRGHLGEVWGVDYSPDGQFIYSGGGGINVDDNRLIQWDAQNGDLLQEFIGHEDRIYAVAASPDGSMVATGSQDSSVIIWDVETVTILHELNLHNQPVFNVMFTNDSSQLISGDADSIIVWDTENGTVINRFENIHSNHILDMDISEDDTQVISGSFDNNIFIWELATGEIITEMSAGQITGARFLPSGDRAVTTDQLGQLIVWNTETGEDIHTFLHEDAPLRGGVAVMPDGMHIIAADDNGNVMMWDISSESLQPVLTFRGHDNRVTAIALNPQGDSLVSSSFDNTLIIWDLLGRGAEIRRFDNSINDVMQAVYSPDGELIASVTDSGQIIVRNTVTNDIIHELDRSSNGALYDIAFNPDATLFATASENGVVTIWDNRTGTIETELTDFDVPVRQVTFSPDGTLLAAGGGRVILTADSPADNRILIWDMDGEIVHTLDEHAAAVRALVFTPDGSQLLSGSDDSQIILWDVSTGAVERTYDNHTDAVWTLAFNADGTQFLSGSSDTNIILWETATGTAIEDFNTHETGVRAVAFHPDGVHALSGAGAITAGSNPDYGLFYWDLTQSDDNKALLRVLPGHTETIRSVSFAPDASSALSAGDDNLIIQWYVDDLQSLLNRIDSTFDIICIGENDNPYCEDDTVITATTDVTADTVNRFPLQAEQTTPYAENSLCLLPQSETYTPSNITINTEDFVAEAPYHIGYSQSGTNNTPSDWIAAWAQYEADAQEDIETFTLLNANNDLDQQIEDIQTLLDEGVDILIVNPVELPISEMQVLEEFVEDIIASGTAVIMVGNRTPEPVYTTYIGQDDYELGCIMTQEIIHIVDGEGNIGLIHPVDQSIADIAFKEGEDAILLPFTGIDRAVEGATSYSVSNARAYTSTQEVIALIGYVGDLTIGAQEGLLSQNVDYVPFVSDHNIDLAQFALENEIDGIFIQTSTQMGATAIQTALSILQGDDVEQFIRVQPILISTEGLDIDALADAPSGSYLGDWEDLPEEYYPE